MGGIEEVEKKGSVMQIEQDKALKMCVNRGTVQ